MVLVGLLSICEKEQNLRDFGIFWGAREVQGGGFWLQGTGGTPCLRKIHLFVPCPPLFRASPCLKCLCLVVSRG